MATKKKTSKKAKKKRQRSIKRRRISARSQHNKIKNIQNESKKSYNSNKSYLDYGFFSEYSGQQIRDNLFFVFQNGASQSKLDKIKFNEKIVEDAQKKARKAVEDAYKYSFTVESSFIHEFNRVFQEDKYVAEAVGNLMEKFGIQDIFKKSSGFSADDLKRFYNSSIFSLSNDVVGSYTDKKQYSKNVDASDFFYQKVVDMAMGLRNSLVGVTNRELAYERLKNKFEEYAKGEQGINVATKTNGLGALGGEIFKKILNSDSEREMLNKWIDEILNTYKPEGKIESILEENKDSINFKIINESNVVPGTFAEYFEAYGIPLLLGRIISAGGDMMTFTSDASGTENWELKTRFKGKGNTTDPKDTSGRTDIRLCINFKDREEKQSKYKINISSKLNKGFSRATTQAGLDNSWSEQHPGRARTVSVYGGGQLASALNRILSSSLMTDQIMTQDNFDDIVFLLINAAQGGIYEQDRSTIVKIYRAIASFCAIDEIYTQCNLGDDAALGEIDYTSLNSSLNPIVVNLFTINGQNIPASQYFKAVLNLIDDLKNEAYAKTNITFANTFYESKYKTDLFMLGYLDYIENNSLTMSNNKSKGDPEKVRDNILANTKAGRYYIIWNQKSKQFFTDIQNI